MKKLLTAVCILILIASLGCADATTLSYTRTIPLSTTNWANSISVPKFDASLGTLNQITFTLNGHVEGAARLENLETIPANITVNLSAMLKMMRPDTSVIVVTIPVVSVTELIAAFDGVIDFGGLSGRTHENLAGNHSETSVSPPPLSDLALFSGTGDIVLPVSADGYSSGSGAGNLLLQFNTLASAEATVTYDYSSVPEPSGLLALLSGLGGLAGLVTRFRKA